MKQTEQPKKFTRNGTIAREAPTMFRIPKHNAKLQKAFDKAVKKKGATAVIIPALEKYLLTN